MTDWWDSPMLSVDTETTGLDLDTARIVTAAAILVGAEGVISSRQWTVNPGIPIPAEATRIHGVTDEQVLREGMNPQVAVLEIVAAMGRAWDAGHPVIIMNAPYDLTVIDRELRRHGFEGLHGNIGPILDPLVIDREVDPYRKGSRKLEVLAAHYGVRIDGAHAADEDALTTARVMWRQARHPKHGPYLQSMGLDEIQQLQAKGHQGWAANYQNYLRKKKRPPEPDAVVDGSWPCVPIREGALT